MSTLERAIAIAAEAHRGQLDKAGESYILHPIRVMLKLSTLEERIAGVLHDVIEDSIWTSARLRDEGFSESIVAAVEAVTRLKGENYEASVARAAAHPVGRRIKLADLQDNLDMMRIKSPGPEDIARIEKYRKALEYIESLT